MTVIPWGSFLDHTKTGDVRDGTFNWSSGPHVGTTFLAGGGRNGADAVLCVGDDSMTFPGQGSLVRVHGIGLSSALVAGHGGSQAFIDKDHEFWMGFTIEVPSDPTYNNPENVVTLELHGDNGSGPAPLNLEFSRPGHAGHSGKWAAFIRGSEFSTANPPGGFPFEQNVFGADHPGATHYDGTYYRHQQDFVGGNKDVVEGEKVDFRMGWFLSTDPSLGWFQMQMRWDDLTDWRTVVPRKTGIRTCYKNIDGSGRAIEPFMSLYYPTGGGGKNAVIYSNGFVADNYAELAAAQDASCGYAGGGGSDDPYPGYTFEWRRCDAAGGSCVVIAGETGWQYTKTPTDVGHTIRVAATPPGGGATIVSDPTPLIS